MDRKAVANETLRILKCGYYEFNGRKVDISKDHKISIEKSTLITPHMWEEPIAEKERLDKTVKLWAENIATTKAILDFNKQGLKNIGVLNFASAKNPGGGFLNGAMAQEESLAASSGLYETLIAHPEYYSENRVCNTMIYTNHAIFSPDVVFFRDERFGLIETPVTASVLTMPAVNFGQVLLKSEDIKTAKMKMRERMGLILRMFAEKNCENLILGAYGCGVFRNNPIEIAKWWMELLNEGEYMEKFDNILFAVLDRSKKKDCILPFEKMFGGR